ncbi:RNA-guided endonuclease InsQ/TnpB family protein [Acetohalobium arabaticum]|uniref:Transposase, IS605 OrfB family n=1 Tax=Acetohalobium arabaticum (strain ATCC 49924 / DSM 5501 / Z-7288) TaxID=574087 RepID=D9QPG5_ACEAZ|nr:RNA-guided endonuclease TnpB family protein [Acetohalobium arabaticum]ADL12406.1 transposase, IS605 OrfB family [Acetohalobium arabaticum DSM 5501]ADL12891.1 transposase, IS605 OrfB family [Acetohalobium arabaticum DSM 5501]
MKLSFKFKPDFSHKQLEIVKELSWHCSKLYNITNYAIKNNKDIKPVYTRLENNFKDNWHTDYLHSHNRQQLFKQLVQDWKSYFNSIEDYNNNPSKYQGQPRPPKFKYLDNNPSEVIFTNLATRIREGNLLLSLSKEIKNRYQVDSLKFRLPTVIESLIDEDNLSMSKGHSVENSLQQVRIKQDNLTNQWYLLIIYKQQPKENSPGDNIMSIDLGLDNLATLTFKDNTENYIINGKPLKSKNKYFNQEINRLQSIRMKQTGSKKFKDTKQIKKLRTKRRNYVFDYLHKASRKIVNLAKKHNVSKIVIGDLKEIKQGMDYNKSFVQVPIQRLKDLIEYKAKLEGIEVNIINEAYTSGCSAIDLEKLNKDNYNKSRRVERGLFQSNFGLTINADVNGSLNIMRKFLDKCIPELINRARDNGVVNPPKRLRVA